MTVGFFEGIFVFASKVKESVITLSIQFPDILGLHAPKYIRSAVTSRNASSLMEVIGDMVGHDEAGERL